MAMGNGSGIPPAAMLGVRGPFHHSHALCERTVLGRWWLTNSTGSDGLWVLCVAGQADREGPCPGGPCEWGEVRAGAGVTRAPATPLFKRTLPWSEQPQPGHKLSLNSGGEGMGGGHAVPSQGAHWGLAGLSSSEERAWRKGHCHSWLLSFDLEPVRGCGGDAQWEVCASALLTSC